MGNREWVSRRTCVILPNAARAGGVLVGRHGRLLSQWAVFWLVPVVSIAFAAEPDDTLSHSVEQVAADFDGSIGVYARDFKTGRTFGFHQDELFCTASVFKLPVMVDLFRRAEAGELNLKDRRRVSERASRHGTGLLKCLRDSPELSLEDLCRLMIIHSDNIATDTLMEIADPESVTRTMEQLGFPKTRVSGNVTRMHYGLIGIDSSIGSLENDELLTQRSREGTLVVGGFADRSLGGNVTTPAEMGRLLEQLELGEVVSESASQQMLEIMRETASRSMIPKYLPPGTVVAHKVGGTWRVKADVGIAYLESGPVVMSLFAYCDPEERRETEVLARIAERIAVWADAQK